MHAALFIPPGSVATHHGLKWVTKKQSVKADLDMYTVVTLLLWYLSVAIIKIMMVDFQSHSCVQVIML